MKLILGNLAFVIAHANSSEQVTVKVIISPVCNHSPRPVTPEVTTAPRVSTSHDLFQAEYNLPFLTSPVSLSSPAGGGEPSVAVSGHKFCHQARPGPTLPPPTRRHLPSQVISSQQSHVFSYQTRCSHLPQDLCLHDPKKKKLIPVFAILSCSRALFKQPPPLTNSSRACANFSYFP